MHAIVLVARAELRRRWLSLLVIGLMAGLSLAMAAMPARRGGRPQPSRSE